MRTILIDPEKQTVEELEFMGNYTDIQNIIGCRCFTTLNLGGETNDAVFVDDEGLFHDSGYVFTIEGRPLVGKGLIMGCDDEGESISTTVSLEEVRYKVRFRGECTINL